MINVVLVDDDVLALSRLKSLIRFDGVRIAGQFTQPEQALAFILHKPVDILMTDMKMPKLDGVELIRRVKAVKPDVAVICISSYEDFHYVKESFRQGSVDYILKHALDEAGVTRALGDAIQRIRRHRNPAEDTPVSEELRAESLRAFKNSLLTQLLNGELTAESVLAKMEKYGLKPGLADSVLLLCEIDDYRNVTARFSDKDKTIFHQAVTDLFERVLARVGEKAVLRLEEDRYGLLLAWPQIRSRLYLFNEAHELSRRINYNMENMLNATMSIAISEPCSSLEKLVSAHQRCRDLLANKLYAGKGRIHHALDAGAPAAGAERAHGAKPIDASGVAQDIARALAQGKDGYREPLASLFQRFAAAKIPRAEIEPQLVTLLNAGYGVVDRQRLTLPEHLQFHVLYPALRNAETLADMNQMLLCFYDEVAREASSRADMLAREYNKLTIEAIDFIKQRYHEPVSLQEAADVLGVHPTYLSKVFKADTGQTFTEYLNRCRIEHAIELLRTRRYSIKQIYREVGFNQYTYFFRVFRQITGVSPSEYEA